MSYATREAWLEEAKSCMAVFFEEIGKHFPKNVSVSCGWPSVSALAVSNRRIGEAWAAENSARQVFELFISPYLDKPSQVLATLLHEMIHASAGLKCGHRGEFKRQALELGLTGRMTETVPTPPLAKRLNALSRSLGPYPHKSLDKMTTGRTKQRTRMIKILCPGCGYTARTTQKWIDTGLPTCPCGKDMLSESDPADDDDSA